MLTSTERESQIRFKLDKILMRTFIESFVI